MLEEYHTQGYTPHLIYLLAAKESSWIALYSAFRLYSLMGQADYKPLSHPWFHLSAPPPILEVWRLGLWFLIACHVYRVTLLEQQLSNQGVTSLNRSAPSWQDGRELLPKIRTWLTMSDSQDSLLDGGILITRGFFKPAAISWELC